MTVLPTKDIVKEPKTTATRQFPYFALARVKKGALAALRTRLKEIDVQTTAVMRGQSQGQVVLPFQNLMTVHYARFVVIGGRQNDGPMLAFSTNYDGPEGDDSCSERTALKRHIEELVSEARTGLESVFQHCRGFRKGKLAQYLNKNRIRAQTFYVGSQGRSRDQILWEAELRRRVDGILDAGNWSRKDPEKIRDEVSKKLKPHYNNIPSFPPQPDREAWRRKVKTVGVLAAVALLAAVLILTWNPDTASPLWIRIAAVAATAIVLLGWFRHKEKIDPVFEPKYTTETHQHFAWASQGENQFLGNQLTHLVDVKPGVLRWVVIRVVFLALQVLSRHWFNRGKLGGIASIHFARWTFIPNRGVLFFSNFDGSWQNYLGDFINQSSSGLTAVWSNTVDYPRTKWLLKAGSRDAARFLAWTRYHQIPSQVWYCAYPGLSIVNVNANTEIRRGLANNSAMDAATWLFRIRGVDQLGVDELYGEEKVQASTLPLDKIQGLILRGYGHKPAARFLLLKVKDTEKPGKAVTWLSELPVTSAAKASRAHQPLDFLLNVAFSYSGLRALGIDKDLCDGFSTPFVQGSHNSYRARVNGDFGDSAPKNWRWGSEINAVHIALLVYASEEEIDKFAQMYLREAEKVGLKKVEVLEGNTLHGRKEHFGFRDGISQPIVKGSGRAEVAGNTVAPGEFLLGHTDGYGNTTHSPAAGDYNFGLNGSYLVFRQLAQDVEGFWKYCASQNGTAPTTVASKMVGRWPSGAPLVRHPQNDPKDPRFEDDDHFAYLADDQDNDRYGDRCPFGSHLRRSNPRDWQLGDSREESLRLSNLHRIIRRGRPYGEPLDAELDPEKMTEMAVNGSGGSGDGATERGLQFLCFNANLERQFEFVQQQWCNNPKFAGGNSDSDPLLGPKQVKALGLDPAVFTVQSDVRTDLQNRYTHINQFVRVVGSTYFFMPSLPALKQLHKGPGRMPVEGWDGAARVAGGQRGGNRHQDLLRQDLWA